MAADFKQMQLADVTAKTLRAALADGEDLILFDGGTPVARLVVGGAELKRRADFFKFYPHDAVECFGTCWRHNGTADKTEAETEPADEPVPA